MRRIDAARAAPWIIVVALATIVAGCLDGPAPPRATADPPTSTVPTSEAAANATMPPLTEPLVVLTDPAGDATEHNSAEAYAAWFQACQLAVVERKTCRDAVPDESTGGAPAPPALDLISVAVQESAQEIVFVVGLAELSDGAQQFVDSSGVYGALVTVRYAAGTACRGTVAWRALPVPDALYVQAFHSRTNDACEPEPGDPLQGRCATTNSCIVPIAWTIEPGAPGALVLRVPRAQTALLDAGTEVAMNATVWRVGHALPGGQVQPGGDVGTGQFNADGRLRTYPADASEEGRLTLATAGDPYALGEPASLTENLPIAGQMQDGDLDIRSVELADDARNFTIVATLREIPASADRHNIHWQFTTPAKHHYTADAFAEAGVWRAQAHRWTGDRQIPINAEVAVEPGSPGTVAITIPRSDLPGSDAGGLTRAFFGGASRQLGIAGTDGPTGFYYANAQPESSLSFFVPPYRFATDPAEASALPALEVTDPVGDVSAPPDATVDPAFRESRFDVSYAAIHAEPGQRIRVDVGLTGLDELVVPRLYDAVLYGMGIQTERGGWMVALVQDQTGTPTAICGPDVAFLTPDPKPPTLAAGVPVSWKLVPASGDAAGLITFDVPATCFGLEGGVAELPVSRAVARTAVVSSAAEGATSAPLRVLDEAMHEEGGRLVFPMASVVRSPWAEPFGIQNFWDIVGVFLAVLVTLITAMRVILKRLRMKHYLIELEDTADRYHDDPAAYAQALVALRMRLFNDLLANRVTEGHFVMVEERLRGHLSSTRINAFGRAFYQLPPALMLRLQSLLADGRFSTQDHRAITSLLDELHIPAEDRLGVRAQIDLWAQQDQAVARLTRLARRRRGWRRFLPQRAVHNGSS